MRHIKQKGEKFSIKEAVKLTGAKDHNIVNWRYKYKDRFSGFIHLNRHDLDLISKINQLVNIDGYQLWKAMEIIDNENTH